MEQYKMILTSADNKQKIQGQGFQIGSEFYLLQEEGSDKLANNYRGKVFELAKEVIENKKVKPEKLEVSLKVD